MSENLDATSFDSKNSAQESDVDALIAGALKELGTKTEKAKEDASPLHSTPLHVKPIEPVKEEKKVEPPKPETQNAYEETFKDLAPDSIVQGVVVAIDPSGALIDIGYKSEGRLSPDELSKDLKVGDKINVLIEKLENKEGYVVLSKKKADFEVKWHQAYDAYKRRSSIEAKVTSAVKGGLVVDWSGLRGFIPASQVQKALEESLESFVGKILPAKIIELNRNQGKIVLSHKLGAHDQKRVDASKLLEEIEMGQVRHGIVKNLKSFGAFVDLGGVEGLIHLSELSWKRVKHPSEVLKTGQEIDVFVLGVDKTNNKISLGLKELQTDPWANAAAKYHAGQVVKVKVLRLAKFGAFVELEEGLEGLIHISELSKDRIESPDSAVKSGDIVDAKILRILPDEQKIGLSIKDILITKERAELEEQKKEESKVTIAEMIAEKEKQKTEHVAKIEEDIQSDELPN